jgi:serine/threonine protein kinase
MELNDEDCVESIRFYVRNNPDIEVYDYIRRGCNGDVYFGKRKKIGDNVVLKFYWSHPNYDDTEECVILHSIRNENILEIKECRFLAPSFAYFLTPKISGGDLQGIIDSRPVSTNEALKIVAGILMGLTELHSKHSLVHRDLKPGNILIDADTNKAIIADLGAVKKIDIADGYVTASKSTYLYLPPESIKNNHYYFESDIYQVGVILFQLLNGFFPINDPTKWLVKKEEDLLKTFTDTNLRDDKFDELIGKKIIKGSLVDTATLPKYLDGIYKRIVDKATHVDHQKRFKNPSFFLKEIHKALRETPDYLFEDNVLHITHDSGKQFKIYENKKNDVVLEKSISNGPWRKDNSHKGDLNLALSISRIRQQ